MGEIFHSARELLAAMLGHAELYGEAAAQSLQDLKAHWQRRLLWLAGGLLLLHTGLVAAVGLGALSAWHAQWPSPWAWLLCLVPAALGTAALIRAAKLQAPRSLLAEVASEDAQWLRALMEPPAQPAEESAAEQPEPVHERP